MAYTIPADLAEMLTYCRPAGDVSENRFIETFIFPHIDHMDDAGNLWACVGDDPEIMFSSHTDTVHWTDGNQTIEVTEDGWVHKPIGSKECLGADCTAGVWLMLEMIKARVPGLYCFHREEECGGYGSAHVAKKEPHLVDGIKACIAFDRYGFKSVITHQFTQRCCSGEFADSLIDVLGGSDMWEQDDGGSFTDSANYTDLIGECTNISVGYLSQHTASEKLHYGFLMHLRDVLIAADWSKLVFKREPGEVDDEYSSWSRYYFGGRGSTGIYDPDYRYEQDRDDVLSDLKAVTVENPTLVANFLRANGYTIDDLISDGEYANIA